MSFREVLLVDQFYFVCSCFFIVALKQLFMNIREVVYLHLNVNIGFKIVNKSLLPAKIRSY